jgi:CheY-like chemotaxis protein
MLRETRSPNNKVKKMEYFNKFEGLEANLPKKVLVVDDSVHYREKYANLAKEMGLRVVQAENVQEGIEKALADRPDAIITDKDMPDGTGNDFAKAVKQAYEVNIAGITGGNPEEFDEHVDVKLSKDIADDEYKKLVKILLESKQPEQEYMAAIGKYKGEFVEAVGKAVMEYAAIDILVQGYIMAKQLQKGEQPVKGIELPLPREEQVRDMLDIADIGMKPQAMQDAYAELEQAVAGMAVQKGLPAAVRAFVKDQKVKGFVKKIVDDPKAVQEEDCKAFHEAYARMAEEYGKTGK